MKCRHQFFETAKLRPDGECELNPNWKEGDDPLFRLSPLPKFDPRGWGVRVVCALCDEKRNLYSYGEFEIVYPNSDSVNPKD